MAQSYWPKKIPDVSRPFESYLKKVGTTIPTDSLTFFSLKISKSPGYDEISFNVIKNCFSEINMLLKYLFEMSLESAIFPDKLKFFRVIPLFKAGDLANISNYRPLSVLPCFSKSLSELYTTVCINIQQQKKFETLNSLVFKQAIQQSTQLSSYNPGQNV